ncbi:MAG: hypothetical protein AB1679_02740 [Actinomycetota bacterium]
MLLDLALMLLGLVIGVVGWRQRQFALDDLRRGVPTEWPLGGRHQVVGAWVLMVFGLGFVWAAAARLTGFG